MSLMDDDPDDQAWGAPWGRRLLLLLVVIAAAAGVYFGVRSYFVSPPQSARAPASQTPQPAPAPPLTPTPPAARPSEPPVSRDAARAPRPRAAHPSAPTEAAPVAPAPSDTTLAVQSDVDGALVFIDRKYVGKTPLSPQAIAPGAHRLNVSAEGYDPYSENIDVKPGGQSVDVTFKVVRVNERLAVKHKHAFGSCEGTLIATVKGLRYQTDHTSDAFSAPFSDLQVFKVDYLKNNLEIRLRDGHTYNFTEQQGGPDALFVFQRDVQKSIDQLKKQAG
jgi:hypothetical protein